MKKLQKIAAAAAISALCAAPATAQAAACLNFNGTAIVVGCSNKVCLETLRERLAAAGIDLDKLLDGCFEKPETPDNGTGEETPEKPEAPDNGAGEETPEKPEAPDNGTGEETPEKPEAPDNGTGEETPEKPEVPDNGTGEETPEKPEAPDNGTGEEKPEKPEAPDNGTGEEIPDQPNRPQQPETPGENQEESTAAAYAERIVELVNIERAKEGLAPVALSKELEAAALIRTKEIEISFSHTRPNGSYFTSVLTENGISYRLAGENIAWGQKSPEEVMRAWMNSAGHRANILNENFTELGVGYYQNARGVNYFVQLFKK